MLQSAIFADLQVTSFALPSVRLVPARSALAWLTGSFAELGERLRAAGGAERLSLHLRRDIGLVD